MYTGKIMWTPQLLENAGSQWFYSKYNGAFLIQTDWRFKKKRIYSFTGALLAKHNYEIITYPHVAAFSSTVRKLCDSCYFSIFSRNLNFLFQPYFKDSVHINCFMLSHIHSRSRKRLVPERIFTSGLGQLPCVTEPQASCYQTNNLLFLIDPLCLQFQMYSRMRNDVFWKRSEDAN